MTDTDTTVSQEAEARKMIDGLQAKLAEKDNLIAEANKALSEIKVRDTLYEHFQGKEIANAFQVATRAAGNFRDVPADELVAKADEWFEEQRNLFGAGEAPAKQASPFASTPANPQGAGEPNSFQPLMVGTAEYQQWAKGKSGDEIIAAMKRGDVRVSEKVDQVQRSIP